MQWQEAEGAEGRDRRDGRVRGGRTAMASAWCGGREEEDLLLLPRPLVPSIPAPAPRAQRPRRTPTWAGKGLVLGKGERRLRT